MLELLKLLGTGASWLSVLPMNMYNSSHGDVFVSASKDCFDKELEKTDILERANWLDRTLLVEPYKLMKTAPLFAGPLYGGQWIIYSLSMYVAALSNIIYIYPGEKKKCLLRMQKAIKLAFTPEVKYFDSNDWKEDPIKGLKGKKGHLTYLATMCWMIGTYKGCTDDSQFDGIYNDMCEGINNRIMASKDMNVVSFSNNIVFLSDMVQAVLVLQQSSKYFDNCYQSTVTGWMEMAKNKLIHRPTGLLLAEKRQSWRPRVRGSYTALANYYLTLTDFQDFALDQYERMKKVFMVTEPYTGIKEYQRAKSAAISFDLNAGPMLYGLSTSGTAIAIGSATYFGDWQFRYNMLRTAEMGGQTIRSHGERHYRLAEVAAVGEAFVLAMRTNVPRFRGVSEC